MYCVTNITWTVLCATIMSIMTVEIAPVTHDSSVATAAIIGGVVGGIVVLIILAILLAVALVLTRIHRRAIACDVQGN